MYPVQTRRRVGGLCNEAQLPGKSHPSPLRGGAGGEVPSHPDIPSLSPPEP
jgi:hypothetical protein